MPSPAPRRPARPVDQRYVEFYAKSAAVFARYRQVEPLRQLIFRRFLVQRRADGVKDELKRWVRPFLKRSVTQLPDRHADVLVWLETQRENIREALLPVHQELVARQVKVDLVSFYGPPEVSAAVRVFAFPARARAPAWAREAWDALCDCEDGLREGGLERSFYHVAAMLEGLYDELHRVLEAGAPKVVVCASTHTVGGAALTVAARQRGIPSLVLQHGMPGFEFMPLPADFMAVWGASSEAALVSHGVTRARLLAAGSPRHDAMGPLGDGQARGALLRALGRPDRPTFVFFSQAHDLEANGNSPLECAHWLERTAAQYGDLVNIVVRLHPNEDGAVYRDCRHLTVMRRSVPLGIALDGCDWFGSLCSTVLYDGLLYGKPAWQFCADDWPELVDNWRTGLAVRVSSERQLSEMVGDILSRGEAGAVDENLVGRVFSNHPRATQAVTDVVTSLLAAPTATPGLATGQEPYHVAGCDSSGVQRP